MKGKPMKRGALMLEDAKKGGKKTREEKKAQENKIVSPVARAPESTGRSGTRVVEKGKDTKRTVRHNDGSYSETTTKSKEQKTHCRSTGDHLETKTAREQVHHVT